MKKLTVQNTFCSTWFERDRQMVIIEWCLGTSQNGPEYRDPVAEFWDETVTELVEDGFLNPRDWHGSAVTYLNWLWGLEKSSVMSSVGG